ncbi:MAG: choice-of-anchor D domain-containing protein [Terriglobales bacterium]
MSCSVLFVLSGCGGSIVVSGAGTGALVASPNSVTFGAVSVGQTASIAVSLVNGGSAPVEITQLNLTGQPFSVVAPSDLPVTIAAGGTYSLNVQFNPAATGTATGQLTVASNASTNGTALIALSGTGMAAPPALSALSCNSGAMTGSGTDACTVTLSTAAPNGGLNVNLSSSSSAVTVPNTVTVPAGAVSAGFTATASSVATAQAVTMTAGASGIFTSFTLQLNAAILALSINATSVAFGDVMVNTPATQSITLTSTGSVPVTVNGATLTGASFTLPGEAFPATLSPGQKTTLNIEFDPTAVGAATGQLTIASNSSTNGTAVIGLSGSGTAAPVVAVALAPTNPSVTTGTTQQFTASVTGTSNTAVTWTVSGAGCSGATCGTISSNGLYTAPATVPSSASVTITVTSQSDPTKSASANVSIVPPQATGYNLVWEDTFSTLSLCTADVPSCNWYNPGVWWEAPAGTISDPTANYVNLQWVSGQANNTNISTSSPNEVYYRSWTFGYFEISMKFDTTTGSAPGIWMMPPAENAPSSVTNGVDYGELDIFEWQSNTPATGYATAHVWLGSSGTDDIANNNATHAWAAPTGTEFSNYNTYGLLWTPTAISWYFNNVLVKTLNTTAVPYNAAYGGALSYFLILSQNASCNWTNPCPGQVSPTNMQVQWVHIYTSPATPE